jgi:hypothetical protein
MIQRRQRRIASVLFLLLLGAGCDSDQRLVRQAEQAADRQAEQNREIARQNQELAQATNQLVAADAQARKETLLFQQGLQAEQAILGQKRDDLEVERRQVAADRWRDPLIAVVLADLGLLAACLAPLLLCGYLLRGLKHEPAEQELAELLAVELVSETPLLLPMPEPQETCGPSRLNAGCSGPTDENLPMEPSIS